MGVKKTTVGVKELKNRLSAYLRDVRQGEHVLVADRGTVIAELREPAPEYAGEDEPNPLLARWAREGIVTLAARRRAPTPKSPIRSPKGTAARLMDDDRDERAR